MQTSPCEWTLNLSVRGLLSIRKAWLTTRNRINIIAGKNGCGKSQLLRIIATHKNRHLLRTNWGYRTYWSKDSSEVIISGQDTIYIINPRRVLGEIPQDIQGPFSFKELQGDLIIKEKYYMLRYMISKLAFESEFHKSNLVRNRRKMILNIIINNFASLFAGRSLMINIDLGKQEVAVFVRWDGMDFIRPDEKGFKLQCSPSTLSDGETNALFMIFEFLYQSYDSNLKTLFLVDEIENHLHPELQERFMKLIMKIFPARSMLLATTHSPSVIAAISPESRILMLHSAEKDQKGNLFQNQLVVGPHVSKIFYEIYGGHSAHLAAGLLTDVHRVANEEILPFAVECLLGSEAKDDSKSYDPQRVALSNFIRRFTTNKKILKVLNIGAGRGREIKGLREDLSYHKESLIHFDLVEPNPEYQYKLREMAGFKNDVIKINKICNSIAEIPKSSKYNLILINNVLHELNFSDTLKMFKMIIKITEPSAYLCYQEQNILPRGETSYFVYEPVAIVDLFKKLGFQETLFISRDSYSGIPLDEITCGLINNSYLINAKDLKELLITAINETLNNNIKRYSKAIRQKDPIPVAFLAFNMANGWLRLIEAKLES